MVIVALFFTACADNDGSDNDGQPYGSDMVTMTLQISTGQNIQTRAQTGLVNGEGSENKIYDIQVWAFPIRHTGVGFPRRSGSHLTPGGLCPDAPDW